MLKRKGFVDSLHGDMKKVEKLSKIDSIGRGGSLNKAEN
jgi:hypothetical protein